MTDVLKPLNKQEQVFVNEYLKHFNATEAYLKIHPKSKRESAWANASRMIGSDNVKAHIEQRLKEIHMSADEALKLLADIARGDIGDLMDTTSMGFEIDMDRAKKEGLSKLVKKIKNKTEIIASKNGDNDREVHTQEIELYSAHEAIRDVLKVHEKLKEPMSEVTINIVKASDASRHKNK